MMAGVIAMATLPFAATVGWIGGNGTYPGDNKTIELTLSPISLCHIEGSGEYATSSCFHKSDLCVLSTTSVCCEA